MSSRKNVLSPQLIESAHSLAASFNSAPTVIDYLDNCAYQVNITTTNSTGTIAVQGSLDYVPANNGAQVANTGTWVDLTLGGGTPTVGAANDSILINLQQVPFHAVRLVYTSTVAGTGTANIYVMAKMI